jgi:hypothetical protein
MKVLKDMGDAILSKAKNIGEKVNEKIDNNKNGSKKDKNVLNIFADKLDVNGDGKVDLKDFVLMAVKVPGVNINRREFLKKELGKKNNEKKVAIALEQNPKLAKIDDATIEYIADDVIEAERKKVVAISAALGVSGAAPITLPADITQYFAFMLRAAQKLMYLYGYPELNVNENMDDDTVNVMAIALGTMMGVQGADAALRSLSGSIVKTISAGIKVSTKGVPQFIGSLVGVGLGKLGFGVVGLSLPIIGGAISGGLTHVTFTSACDRLRKELRNGPLNDEKKYEVD